MAASRPAANEMNETAKLYRSRSDLIRMNEGSDVRRDGDTVSRGDDHLPMSTMIDTREPPAYTPDRHDRRLPSRRFGDTSSSSTRRIVVAADGSPSSTQGLRQVADLLPASGQRSLSFMFGSCPLQPFSTQASTRDWLTHLKSKRL